MNDTGEEEDRPPFLHYSGGSHGDPFEGSSDADDVDDGMSVPWWYTVLLILGFFGILLASVLLREFCYRCYGIKLCSRPLLTGNGNEYQQRHQRNHPGSSNNLQGLTSEELREQQVEQQRMERKIWYQYFLKPYVTVSNKLVVVAI